MWIYFPALHTHIAGMLRTRAQPWPQNPNPSCMATPPDSVTRQLGSSRHWSGTLGRHQPDCWMGSPIRPKEKS